MILIIDDDVFGVSPYKFALEDAGFGVTVVGNPDDALRVLKTNRAEIELIVLDILMPSGQRLSDSETSAGLETGTVLFDLIRREFPSVPVVVFSITNSSGIKADHPTQLILHKEDTLPKDLVEIVKSLRKKGA